MLKLTGSTLNLQSYMGIIMSVGVSIANSVLLITNAEHLRLHNGNAWESAREAAALRLRPILMTTIAMVAGMIPMGPGEEGKNGSRCTIFITVIEVIGTRVVEVHCFLYQS